MVDGYLTSSATMEDAINILQLNNMKIVFVVDEEFRLLGTITDGDVRRSI